MFTLMVPIMNAALLWRTMTNVTNLVQSHVHSAVRGLHAENHARRQKVIGAADVNYMFIYAESMNVYAKCTWENYKGRMMSRVGDTGDVTAFEN